MCSIKQHNPRGTETARTEYEKIDFNCASTISEKRKRKATKRKQKKNASTEFVVQHVYEATPFMKYLKYFPIH